jgi:hypothetical protein
MEFLYFIQRPDRIFASDQGRHAHRFFNFRNDVLPARLQPTPVLARLPA